MPTPDDRNGKQNKDEQDERDIVEARRLAKELAHKLVRISLSKIRRLTSPTQIWGGVKKLTKLTLQGSLRALRYTGGQLIDALIQVWKTG